jgi:zona occludens toxin (predicted ATPase)
MLPRRQLGFGFVLFLVMVALAFVYAQFVVQDEPAPGDALPVVKRSVPESGTPAPQQPLPEAVTPDAAVDDLIDEALADRDDLSLFEDDELADVEEAAASINTLETVYDDSQNQ